jgi:DNA repair photolyase
VLVSLTLPEGVSFSSYRITPPLIKPSKIYEMGGWVVNFAIGCTFGCKFCYVDGIHKKFTRERIGNIVLREWGYYFLVPENIEDAIEKTNWKRWKGKNVMMSSTHDPYLPHLYKWTRKIIEKALEAGVRINILTRSPLVERDFEVFSRYKENVSLSVSVATLNEDLSRVIEPRVVSPLRRLEIIRKAKDIGIRTGVHIAPIFPPNRFRKKLEEDIEEIARYLFIVKPDKISAESLHPRGINMFYLREALGEEIKLEEFDKFARKITEDIMRKYNLECSWS